MRRINGQQLRPERDFVLYWMTAARRTRHSFALDHAIDRARELGKPLVVLEALRVGYRWASDRLHRFVLDGMADNAERFERAGVLHYAYVEREAGAGRGLLAALAARACLVIADEYPCFFLPRMVEAAARRVDVRMEQVDGCGLFPLRAVDRLHVTARGFRSWIRKNQERHRAEAPRADPLARLDLPAPPRLPAPLRKRWLPGLDVELASLPIDHAVPVAPARGGERAARTALRAFVRDKLASYDVDRNHPDRDGTSGLSPYLHFGHLGTHAILEAVAGEPAAAPFVDQLVTWRELGFNMCHRAPDDYAAYESLPGWAQRTLDRHATDPRPELYTLEELEQGRTRDPLWNASQQQLLREGRIHNYLRMLWGKKILEWSPSPREALARMIHLNDRHALDGRDPNSYSGIAWVLGRYDRAWGPERPVFGKIRYMTSASAARKLRLKEYVKTYGA